MAKKYYWLKLKNSFFNSRVIKKLKKQGDAYVVIYLKLQLLSLEDEGRLYFEGVEDSFEEEMALTIDEDVEKVKATLEQLEQMQLIKKQGEAEYLLCEVPTLIGSEADSAERVRRYRSNKASIDAQSKKKCEEKQHIPQIDNYTNNKRYNGNYYVVMQRDKYKCALCGSIENLCVHHIDGYSEDKPQNSNTNKMITLCRTCHSNIHAGQKIDKDTLDSIDYYIESNEMLLGNGGVTTCNGNVTMCNGGVTTCNTEIEREIEKEKDIDTEKRRAKVDYQLIADMYNDTCVSFPRLKSLSDSRKKAIKARLNVYTVDDFKKVFTLAEDSKFLKGANKRNWSANFDWMIKDANFAKILDGNYQDRKSKDGQEFDEFYEMTSKWAESEEASLGSS